jgi:voltage-gated potassium channel
VGDTLVLGAESFGDDTHINLKEIQLRKQNPWNGQRIRELDISRQTIIIMVKRKGKVLIPNGDLRLLEGDTLILYTKMRLDHANNIEI